MRGSTRIFALGIVAALFVALTPAALASPPAESGPVQRFRRKRPLLLLGRRCSRHHSRVSGLDVC